MPELVASAVGESNGFEADEALCRADLELAANERNLLLQSLDDLGPAENKVLSNSEVLETSAACLWGQSPAPSLPLKPRAIQRRVERLLLTRWFPRLRTHYLFRRLGCTGKDRDLDVLRAWALGIQIRPELLEVLGDLEQVVGDTSVSVPLADLKWQAASLSAVRSRIANALRGDPAELAAFSTSSGGHGRLIETIHVARRVLR